MVEFSYGDTAPNFLELIGGAYDGWIAFAQAVYTGSHTYYVGGRGK